MIIEAKDFAGPKIENRHHFGGAERQQIVAALEKFIAGVRAGRVLVQDVIVSAKVRQDEWLLTTLSLTYAEQDEPQEPRQPADNIEARALYGSGKFPVEIRRVS